jgi:hypothetical protein
MPLQVLARKDELGNNASHFFKSGNVLRNPKCSSLGAAKLLPPRGLYKTNLEYDLWYDMGGTESIHGYVYTDALSDYLYIRPANSYFSDKAMFTSLKPTSSGYGERLVDEMGAGIPDKYRLKRFSSKHRFVIFLPGTNCIQEALDWDKAKAAVAQGAVVKPHPISSMSLLIHLNRVFGAENVLDRRDSGHDLMNGADIVGCCVNSEMGIAAIAAGKGFHIFSDLKNKKHFSYTSVYRAVLSGGSYRENLIKVLDSPSSGMIHGKSEDALDRIASFFNQFSEVPHVEPKNTNS